MAGFWIRLSLVAALCFSCLIYMNGAIPITRSSKLMQKPDQADHEATKTVLLDNWKVEESGERRMEIEVNDYPGSGANNRHTPRAQIFKDERRH